MKTVLIMLLVSVSGFAQGLFEVRTSHQTMGINELLRVDFITHDDGEKFVAPVFEGFIVKEGPVTRQYEETVNGKMKYNFEYAYLLQPQKKGTLTIGTASVVIGGEVFKSNPIAITVGDAVKLTKKLQTLEPPLHPAYLETDDE